MSVKEQVLPLAQCLSEEATWDDVAYEVYVRQTIEKALLNSQAGNTLTVEEVRARLAATAPRT
jgi:hypothetical protein